MAKKKSKRKLTEVATSVQVPELNLLCNIKGETEINEFENCLQELSEQQHYNDVNTKKEKILTKQGITDDGVCINQSLAPQNFMNDGSTEENLWDPSIRKPKVSTTTKQGNSAHYYGNSIPNVQLEMARHLQMKNLSTFLLQACPNIRMPTFERWVIDSKMEEREKRKLQSQQQNKPRSQRNAKKGKKKRKLNSETENEEASFAKTLWWDPVIPSCPELSDLSCIRLRQEIDSLSQKNTLKNTLDSESICFQLCVKSKEATKNIYNMVQRIGLYQNLDNKKAGEKILLEKRIDSIDQGDEHDKDDKDTNEADSKDPSFTSYSLVYRRKKLKKPFVIQINASHYKKLKDMFHHSNQSSTQVQSKQSKHIFHFIMFTLLLRYSSLSGGQLLQDLRGGGMQGAIHTQVFQYLNDTLDCRMECFASPLNTYYCNYCSAFEEEQLFFGSFGSFFDVKSMEGCFEANPPFAPGLMKEMVDTMEYHLNTAKENGALLTFVIIVPTCKESFQDDIIQSFASKSFQSMLQSSYFVHHSILKARCHGYIEAAQHLRPTRFKQSQYDTSVIVLQSDVTRYDSKWWNNFKIGLQKSFESRHEKEMEERGTGKK